ncbi:MAG TPA: GPW/gp25 family protein [Symbiobacteriaceae bacterium]|nr:GPW/gp25 family protein [Symbiobacteriaceae bacterium]
MAADYGRDLAVMRRKEARSAVRLTLVGGDMTLVDGLDNLAQAIWFRLATNQGDLAHLGHPDYGSRLYRLIGRLITPETLALAKAYVREALRQEPRIAAIEALTVAPGAHEPGTLRIELTVRPAQTVEPLNLALSFALEPLVEA